MFARLSLFAMVAALMGTHVLALNCQANYTVVSGDNCVAIAAKFNVSDATLLADNSAVDANCDNLSVGEKLCIPFPPTGCSAQHTVISGDNCVAIAAEFGTTFAALVAANSAVNAECSNLTVGEVLCIPCATQYTVRPGDVCDSIAAQFDVTAAELQAANAAVDPLCDNLAVGEVLCIPSEA